MGSLVTEEAQIQAEELGKGDVGSEMQKWWCEMGRTSFCTGPGRQRSRPDNTLVLGGALISGEESGGCGTDALPAQSPLRTGSEPFHSTNPDSVGSRKRESLVPAGEKQGKIAE